MTGCCAMCRIVAWERVAGWGIAADLLPQVPEVVPVGARDAGVVRTRLVDDRHPQPLAVGLRLAGDVDVHAVGPSVAVGVELGLDPEVVADPGGRIGEGGDDLGLAVLDDGAGLGGGRGAERGQGEEGEEGGGGGRGAGAVRAGAVGCARAGGDHRDFVPEALAVVGIVQAGAASMRKTVAILAGKPTGTSRSAHSRPAEVPAADPVEPSQKTPDLALTGKIKSATFVFPFCRTSRYPCEPECAHSSSPRRQLRSGIGSGENGSHGHRSRIASIAASISSRVLKKCMERRKSRGWRTGEARMPALSRRSL